MCITAGYNLAGDRLETLGDEFLQETGILGEVTNALGELLRGHGVLVHGPAEVLLIHGDLLNILTGGD